MVENLAEKIIRFEKRSWAMKPYAAFRWGSGMPCPVRLVVNTYKGCDFKHKYCYVWQKCGKSKPKEGFRKSLKHDIKRAKESGLDKLVAMVSSSTDPFQEIEKEHRETQFALKELLDNGFKVLIMTRNPKMLLEKEYLEFARNKNLFIDVSIPSLHENNPESFFFGTVPKLEETLKAIKKLSAMGKDVRVKIEPVVPSVNGIQGQTEEELDELVGRLKAAGVKLVISKAMRLNEDVPKPIYDKLIAYYKKNGFKQGINLVLSKEKRKELLQPVLNACKKHKMPFCGCVETGTFSEKTSKCLCRGEKVPPIMSIVGEASKEWVTEEVE